MKNNRKNVCRFLNWFDNKIITRSLFPMTNIALIDQPSFLKHLSCCFLSFGKNSFSFDERPYLYRHIRTSIGTDVPVQARTVPVQAHGVPIGKFTRTCASTEVYSIKVH
jgi:hypothetical protein